MSSELSLERFSALLAAYGARFELWPEAEREAARSLAGSSAEARALVAAEVELDAEFAASEPPEPRAEFWRRVNEVPLRAPQRRRLWPFGGAWVPAFGWAFAACVGLGLGFVAGPLDTGELDQPSAVASADSAVPDATPLDDDFTELARGTLVDWEE